MSTVISVGNELELNQAIATVDAAATGTFVIQLTANVGLGTDTGQNITFKGQTLAAPAELYALNLKNGVAVTIDGQNHAIDGSIGGYSLFRGLFVYAGNVTVQNLTIQNTKAVGGDGYNGGGGGAGLGGGLYVANDTAHGAASAGNVTLDNVTFTNNSATGGTTDFYSNVPTEVAGGGGGLGGLDGQGTAHSVGHNGSAFQGGGGIGSTADGGNVQSPPGGGIVLGTASGGVGYAGTGQNFPGGANGGGGAGTEGSGDSSYAGGGGGIGGQAATSITQGGAGGYGGGGGEAAAGGFGGGGGSGGSTGTAAGGAGGFGGGGGGSKSVGGKGGFGAGNGSSTQEYTGGGGLGAGGAIFVQQGASLTYMGGSITNGSVAGGAGATAGQGLGSGIFLQGNESITFAPANGETLTIASDITDQTSSGGTGANAGVGTIIVAGQGTVALTGQVKLAGGIQVGGGTTISATTVDSGQNVTNLGTGVIKLNGGTLRNDTGTYAYINNPIQLLANGGAIDANGQSTFIDGPLSGSGPLLLESTGRQINIELNADNSAFTGATTVALEISLAVDSDKALASHSAFVVLGSIQLNGHSGTMGSLSGTGVIYNGGPQDVTLTAGGDNTSTTYSGSINTDIEGGALKFVKAGTGTLTLSSEQNSLADGATIAGGTLVFDPSSSQTIAGSIDGAGSLQKLGTGYLTLAGTDSYTGNTTIGAGTLIQQGTSVSAVTVQSGAALGGGGTTGAVTVQSGGKLLPGSVAYSNQAGSLRTGNLKLNAGATLVEELNGTATGSFSSILVTGSVDLTGSTLDLETTTGYLNSITPGTSFTIIQNDGTDTVTGTFGNEDAKGYVLISPGLPYSAATQAYLVNTHGGDGNDVTLTMVNTQPNLYQLPASQTVSSGSSLAFSGSKRIHVADADQGQTLTVTLTVAHGTLATTGTASSQSGVGTGTLTITGTASGVDTTLGTLSYMSSAGYGGSDSLGITIKDNSGATNNTATAAVALTVTGGTPDTTPPSLTFGSAAIGAVSQQGTAVTLTGTASDNSGVASVSAKSNTTSLGPATLTGTAYSLTAPVPGGALNTVSVTATDTLGNATTQAVSGLAALSFTSAQSTATVLSSTLRSNATVDGGNLGGNTLVVAGANVDLSALILSHWTASDVLVAQGLNGQTNLLRGSTAAKTTLLGGNGTDVFYVQGGGGPDIIDGGGGTNIVNTASAAGTGTVVVDLKDGYLTRGSQTDAYFAHVQGVQLGSGPSTVVGLTSGTDQVTEGSGTSYFYGEGATDYVQGGTGTDSFTGGSGAETFGSGGGTDFMVGGSGANTMTGGTGTDDFTGTGGTDYFYAGPNYNVMHGAAAGGHESLFGSIGTDILYGGGGTSYLLGGNGYEVLVGGKGLNDLIGTTHPDSNGHVTTNVMSGGTGSNAGTDVFQAGIGTNIMYEGSGTSMFTGGTGSDYIYGGSGNSTITGGSGLDDIFTGAGNQHVYAGTGSTIFNETAAYLKAGRFDEIDQFKVASGATGGKGTFIYLPTANASGTSFVDVSGGAVVVTPATSGASGYAEIYLPGATAANVQHQTVFGL